MQSISRFIGPLLGIVLTIWLLYNIDLQRMVGYWSEIDTIAMLLGLLLSQLSMFVRALRWHYLLRSYSRISLRKLYSALMVGMASNWILPFRIGETAGAYSLCQLTPLKFTTIMASVVADRLLDILWLIAAMVIFIVFFPIGEVLIPGEVFGAEIRFGKPAFRNSLVGFIGLGIVVLAGLCAMYYLQNHVKSSGHRVRKVLPESLYLRLRALYLHFIDGLHVLRNPFDLGMAVMHTIILWTMALAGTYFFIDAFPFDITTTVGLALAVLISCTVGLSLPNAPGFIGTFHITIILGLLVVNSSMDINKAIGFAIIYHLALSIPTLIIGILFMWIDDLKLVYRKPKADNAESG